MLVNIFGFSVSTILIFLSGRKLSYYGNAIAKLSGLGGVWIGLILMATVTSLPELTVGISSVAIVGSADLAVGDVLGSCVFNLTILSLLDALSPGPPVLTKVGQSHVLAVSLTTILLAMVGLGLFLGDDFIVIGWIGITSLAFAAIYLLSVRLMHQLEVKNHLQSQPAEITNSRKTSSSLKRVILWYMAHAVIVVAAALALPHFAEGIASETSLGESFVGTVFLAASSSFPEMAVAISAARMSAIDMAVGNLFGSNIFNIFTLFVNDLFYTKGYLLKDASDSNIITILAVIIMNSIAIAALIIRPEKKRFQYLAWDTLLILLIYVATMVLLLSNL